MIKCINCNYEVYNSPECIGMCEPEQNNKIKEKREKSKMSELGKAVATQTKKEFNKKEEYIKNKHKECNK